MVDEKRDRGEEARGGGARGEGRDYRNRIFEHTQEAREEAQMLASSLGELSGDVSSYVQEQCRRRPWAVLGVAAAVGYVLGGGLPSRITRGGLSLAMRMGTGLLVRQFMEGQGVAWLSGVHGGGEASEGETGV